MRAVEAQARRDRVMELWAQGLTNVEIGRRKDISANEVGRMIKAAGKVPHPDVEMNGDLNKALNRAAPLGSPFSPCRRG